MTTPITPQGLPVQPSYYVQHPDDSYSLADPQPSAQAASAAPVARFNWGKGGFEWLVPYEFDLHNMRPLYLCQQPTQAASVEPVASVLYLSDTGLCSEISEELPWGMKLYASAPPAQASKCSMPEVCPDHYHEAYPAQAVDAVSLRFRKKPVVIEASQWFKNGDHPLDYSRTHHGLENGQLRDFQPQERQANAWEGDIVRYYRTPSIDGKQACKHCGKIMHEHGWIDTLEGGHIVCPGDWIITGVNGEFYPCKPDIFAKTYEPAKLATARESALIAERDALRAATKQFYNLTIADPDVLIRAFTESKREAIIEAGRVLAAALAAPAVEG